MKTITLTEILEYYDGIQVFAARDPAGGHYVADLIGTEGVYDRYSVIGVRPQRLAAFKAGKVDLRTLMLEAPGGEWYIAVADGGVEDPLTLEPQDGPLEDTDFLPEEGFFLNPLSDCTNRRLIEDWLPINEISIEAIRERSAASALPPVNWLHVWWARRPLAVSRVAIAASLLPANAANDKFFDVIGTHTGIVEEQLALDAAKASGTRLEDGYSRRRAFTHNLTSSEGVWLRSNLAVSDPLVVDITAGGGSIPFEAGRLGLRSKANELNPVAQLILRATCQWPQQYGYGLLDSHKVVSARFQERARELLEGVYPKGPDPSEDPEFKKIETMRAQRYVWSYLWARIVSCPSCKGQIPLSPNWRLDSKGTGIRLKPDTEKGKCEFEIVHKLADQSPGTVKDAIATCPYPNCGSTTPRDYISLEAQAGRLGHQLYCIIYRDQWWPPTKSGKPRKRPRTRRGFRLVTPLDDNSAQVAKRLMELKPQWDAADILPSEGVPEGDKTTGYPLRYGMPQWVDMFCPRQQLAHGYCVQAFRELVDEDLASGLLNDTRKAAWCYVALGLDKLFNRNSLLSRWVPKNETVVGTFDSHDFGMKWSYAEMAVTIEGLGLEWALGDIEDCIKELAQMSGYQEPIDGTAPLSGTGEAQRAQPTLDIAGDSADFLFSLDTGSADAIVFDPPYYDNVSYAELSDFFYVWLKRTAGYVHPEWFRDYLTDKANEAIASPVRFRGGNGKGKGTKSVKDQAYEDYVARMRRIFAECRRIIKDDGIMTIMFTHKTTDAWDALTIGIIEAGFRITATWPVKTESDSSLNIRDRAAARSTILLACRPKTGENSGGSSWESVEEEVAQAVRQRLPILETYDLRPLDIYLASFGPALEVISNSWPIRRELANPQRREDPFAVTPNDALQVARREVFAARRRRISDLWANNPGDPLTEFYILAQDSAGSATIPFDEANMVARCIGLELDTAKQVYDKKGSNVNLLTSQQRFQRGLISPNTPSTRSIDRVHIATALAASSDVNAAMEWCRMQGFETDATFKGTLEALLRVMLPDDPDLVPARTLWTEMYRQAAPDRKQEGKQLAFGQG